MQGVENNADERFEAEYQHLLYPEGNGYRSNTGGKMECLRKLGVEKIRKYHSDYYRSDNLCLIITGKLEMNELLEKLESLDERIASKGILPSRKRPFVDSTPIPPLEKSIQKIVEFPDDDESMGQVTIIWLGPYIHEFLEIRALDILHEYLSDSAISLLQKEFVEIEDPLCTDIGIAIKEQTRIAIIAKFENVPVEDLEELANQVFKVFKRVVEDEKEGIDMDRMQNVIQRDRLKILDGIETYPHSIFSHAAIIDHLYGKGDGSDLEKATKDLCFYDEISKFSENTWKEYLKKYYINNPHIIILGQPSSKLAKKLSKDEKKRIEKQCQELGPEKLKELEKKLEEAKKINDIPVPPEIIEKFPIPGVETIPFINVITGRNKSEGKKNVVQEYLDKDIPLKDLPYFIQYDHINSAFISISLYIITTTIPIELRRLLGIYLESFYGLPLNNKETGKQLSFEEVISELNKETISYDYSLGVGKDFGEIICLEIKVEATKYKKGIQWLKDLLWNTEFTAERLKICTTKLLNDIPQSKRQGYDMSKVVSHAIHYGPKSNKFALNVLNQERILPQVIKSLDTNPELIISEFSKLREILLCPENFRIHVVGDILKLDQPKTSWVDNFKVISKMPPLSPIPLAQHVLTESGRHPGNKGYIVKLSTIESSFSIHTTKGPNTFDSPDLAPLMVLCELLQACEGLFYKTVRGQGLAYSANLLISVELGLLNFVLYRSPDNYEAYVAAKNIINDLVTKKDFGDEFEGAKSGVIHELVNKESNIQKAANQSFILQVLKNLDASFNRELIFKVQKVTLEDLYSMLTKYIVNLFSPGTSNTVIVSTPNKVESIQASFKSYGFDFEIKNLKDISDQVF
ncbi:hypothetical protein Glove_364g19 [Diversispora epigaea]|uniref:Peptidase M16 C-terminal domain-containing protein n=1 Tax=Diversispora epigaea TaxID=1348612 RepID=A0A397H8H9_9GLOM|nr:hypothetical protein Glove_364g19 [Diversispora epigaea]